MIEEKIKQHFLGEKGFKRLNCAQTMAEIFKDKYDFLTDDTVKAFKKMGYGKAPKGECGMLYAAKYILDESGEPDKIIEIENYFIEIAGTTLCRELKKKKIPFCAQCLMQTASYMKEAYHE